MRATKESNQPPRHQLEYLTDFCQEEAQYFCTFLSLAHCITTSLKFFVVGSHDEAFLTSLAIPATSSDHGFYKQS